MFDPYHVGADSNTTAGSTRGGRASDDSQASALDVLARRVRDAATTPGQPETGSPLGRVREAARGSLTDAADPRVADGGHGSGPRQRRPRPQGVLARIAMTVFAIGAATSMVFGGSYAAWTAQTTNPGSSVTGGTLTMSNDKSATSVFAATNVKPGDSGSSTVTVTSTGSLPMTVTLTQDTVTTTGIESSLRLSIHDDTKNYCYWPTQGAGACGSLGAWDASATLNAYSVAGTGGAQWAASEAHTFTVSWQLLSSSPNSDQGKTGSFRLVWDGLQ